MVFNREAPPRGSVAELLTNLLDKRYNSVAGRVVESIGNGSPVVNRRLAELTAEAQRLQAQGQRLEPANPVFRALIADLETDIRRARGRIDGIAPDVQGLGIDVARTLTRQLSLPGVTDAQLSAVGIQWNTPDPEAVRSLVDLVDSPAFAEMLDQYEGRIIETIRRQAIVGLVSGRSPLATANNIRRLVQTMPAHEANTLLRTLQLQSYRSATAIHQAANAEIGETVIRIAALDGRTCLACVALHGTELAIGDRVDDHHNGRCTSIMKVKGRDLPLPIVDGVTWFENLPAGQQRALAGGANYNAWREGVVTLQDFVKPYRDNVFGEMIRENSLRGILGEGAQRYYQRNYEG